MKFRDQFQEARWKSFVVVILEQEFILIQVNLAISSLESIKAYHDSLRNDHSRWQDTFSHHPVKTLSVFLPFLSFMRVSFRKLFPSETEQY